MKSDRFIITKLGTADHFTSFLFSLRLDYYLRSYIKADYKMASIFYTSAIYAFKAECDLPSVASIIGYSRVIKIEYSAYPKSGVRSIGNRCSGTWKSPLVCVAAEYCLKKAWSRHSTYMKHFESNIIQTPD